MEGAVSFPLRGHARSACTWPPDWVKHSLDLNVCHGSCLLTSQGSPGRCFSGPSITHAPATIHPLQASWHFSLESPAPLLDLNLLISLSSQSLRPCLFPRLGLSSGNGIRGATEAQRRCTLGPTPGPSRTLLPFL